MEFEQNWEGGSRVVVTMMQMIQLQTGVEDGAEIATTHLGNMEAASLSERVCWLVTFLIH